jgi:tetratricopeptide (TPR) repeat protein
MDKLIQPLLLSLLMIILFDHSSCFASIYQLKDEIDAYNKRDFQKVVFIGRAIVAEDPSSDTAHYYLANAYTWLRDFEEAIKEYKICLYTARSPKIRIYAEQALQTLQSSTNLISTNQPDPPNTGGADQNGPSMSDMKQKILRKGEEEVARATSDAQKQITEINRNTWEQVSPTSYDAFGGLHNNPIQTSLLEMAKKEADAINYELPKKINAIRKAYQEKAAALDSSTTTAASNFRSELDNIQLIPSTSNLYVQNYVDYGVDSLPHPQESLKAVQKHKKLL